MYTDFYNLREKPFNLTPSSRFLYLGEVHKEALALLTYGVMERKGFILLTGEVGTGKTTMIHALLESLDESVQYVYLSNPLLSPKDFLKYLAHGALKKNLRFKTRGEVLLEFESFLRQCLQHQKNFVLIVDEAQKLSFGLLEEIRLLSNMETGEEKLVNIFLVGQPEFNEVLNEPRCRPLLQRIGIRYHMRPLDLKGTREYIMKRLEMAGAGNGSKLFSKDVTKAIYDYSGGYPRMINILGDNILLLGYSRNQRKITSEMVKECYLDIKIETSKSEKKEQGNNTCEETELVESLPKHWKWTAALLMVFIAILIVGISLIYIRSQQQGVDKKIEEFQKEIRTLQSNMELYQRQLLDTLKSERQDRGSDQKDTDIEQE